ncbi:MAG: hypothetical protein JXQ73_05730 [Phycisphaerae bacterium]|nr:hypothetical protein [Phycisphaerae bacterium]
MSEDRVAVTSGVVNPPPSASPEKQRVRAAFDHVQPDRVPCFEQSIASDVAGEILGREAYCGTTYLHYQEARAWSEGDSAHDDFVEKLYNDVAAMTETLGLDMIHQPWRLAARPTARLDERTFLYGDPEGEHSIYRFDSEAKTFGCVKARQRAEDALGDPDLLEPSVEALEARASQGGAVDLAQEDPWTVRLVRDFGARWEVQCGAGLGVPLDEVWLMACLLRPDLVDRYLRAHLSLLCRRLEAYARLGIYVVWGGGDLADKNGPVYGPGVFRDLVLPVMRELTDACHALGMVYVYRTDGVLWPIEREFFVDSGTDAYGEIDHQAGMTIEKLKPRHGDRITFWGDVPCGTLLWRGTAAEVIEYTKRLIDVAAPGGGFILGSSNSIIPGTPARNVVAMFETAHEYGRS